LLDQVLERVQHLHYSFKTEKYYLYWISFFIRWSATQARDMHHPHAMGVTDVEVFLSMLANERKVSAASTHCPKSAGMTPDAPPSYRLSHVNAQSHRQDNKIFSVESTPPLRTGLVQQTDQARLRASCPYSLAP
jgi:hypothetical protein